MYQLELTTKFKKDIKLAKKRGLNMRLLDEVVTDLVEKGTAAPKNKPHKLTGSYKGFWECHIQPDWLLVWKKDDSIRLITLTRKGTHSDFLSRCYILQDPTLSLPGNNEISLYLSFYGISIP